MEPATIISGAKAFGAAVSYLHRAATPSRNVTITVREWSPTYSLFVPNVIDIQECSPPNPDEIVHQTSAAARWIKQRQALPIGLGEFLLVVQAKGTTSAVIDGITVNAREAEAVPGVALRQALAGPIRALSLEADLDANRVWCIDSRQIGSEVEVDTLFSVSSGDPLVFRVSGRATTRAMLWNLEISMVIDGKPTLWREPDFEWITIPYDYIGVKRNYAPSHNRWTEVD
ncbi:hypothetical protein [Mycobacteroides salmoniphilum]|uniref:hypothetical protein n=1 Tax=Mycobacteroides salmoniphilum TaxID=404941 RepID=UPI0010AADD22|nr:hypothetical protein [Mycobacteroides salmoniphilum]